MGQAWHSACALEEDLSCATTAVDTLVVIKVGNYTLYRITTSLAVADGLLSRLYGSLSLPVALRIEGSGEGVLDRGPLAHFFIAALALENWGPLSDVSQYGGPT